MRFTLTTNMDVCEKLYRKTLLKMYLTVWSVDGQRHWSNYQCEIFHNFVDLCSGVGIVWSTTTRIRVNAATAVIFSVKCFKTLSSVRKHLRKASFTDEHLIRGGSTLGPGGTAPPPMLARAPARPPPIFWFQQQKYTLLKSRLVYRNYRFKFTCVSNFNPPTHPMTS